MHASKHLNICSSHAKSKALMMPQQRLNVFAQPELECKPREAIKINERSIGFGFYLKVSES